MRTLITETWSQYLPRGLKNLVGEEVPEARSEGATRRGRHPRRPVRAAAAWQRPVPAGALRGGAAGADGVDTPHAGAAGGGRRRWERGAGSLFFKSFFSFLQIRVLNLFIQVSQNVSIYTLTVKSPSPLSLYLFLPISKVPNIFPRNFGVIQQHHQKVDQNLYNENWITILYYNLDGFKIIRISCERGNTIKSVPKIHPK